MDKRRYLLLVSLSATSGCIDPLDGHQLDDLTGTETAVLEDDLAEGDDDLAEGDDVLVKSYPNLDGEDGELAGHDGDLAEDDAERIGYDSIFAGDDGIFVADDDGFDRGDDGFAGSTEDTGDFVEGRGEEAPYKVTMGRTSPTEPSVNGRSHSKDDVHGEDHMNTLLPGTNPGAASSQITTKPDPDPRVPNVIVQGSSWDDGEPIRPPQPTEELWLTSRVIVASPTQAP